MNTVIEILDNVDRESMRSEIDVLMSITESYEKALSIISSDDYSDEIIQESFHIYMEDGEEGSSIKALFKRVIMFFKNVLGKLKNLISNIFNLNRKRYIQTYNSMQIINELAQVLSSNVVNEWLNDEISDEVFQEALFDRKSSQEKEEEEYMKGQVAREKELEANVKSREDEVRKLVKDFRKKVYADDKFMRLLSARDVKYIVTGAVWGATKDELRKLRDAIEQIKNGNMQGLDKKIFETVSEIVHIGSACGKNKEESRHWTDSRILSEKKTEIAERKIANDNTSKMTMDVALLEKFADTFGQELNALSGKEYFSADNLKALMYGPQKIITFGALAGGFVVSTICNLVSNAAFALAKFEPSLIIKDITEFGKRIDKMDTEFNEFADNDTVLRKEYGVKLNKTMAVLRKGVLDNIKEETYRWEDCPFNTMTYGQGNAISAMAGGPITLTIILVGTIFFHRPLEEFMPGPGLMGMMGLTRLLNPGRSGKYVNLIRRGG